MDFYDNWNRFPLLERCREPPPYDATRWACVFGGIVGIFSDMNGAYYPHTYRLVVEYRHYGTQRYDCVYVWRLPRRLPHEKARMLMCIIAEEIRKDEDTD